MGVPGISFQMEVFGGPWHDNVWEPAPLLPCTVASCACNEHYSLKHVPLGSTIYTVGSEWRSFLHLQQPLWDSVLSILWVPFGKTSLNIPCCLETQHWLWCERPRCHGFLPLLPSTLQSHTPARAWRQSTPLCTDCLVDPVLRRRFKGAYNTISAAEVLLRSLSHAL